MPKQPIDIYLSNVLQNSDANDDPRLMLPAEIAQDLIRAVRQAVATDDEYWDIQQLSKYIGISTRSVQRHFIDDPRWPSPIVYGNPKQRSQRWLASECRRALLLFRRKV